MIFLNLGSLCFVRKLGIALANICSRTIGLWALLNPGFRPGLLYFALSGHKNSHPDFPNLKLETWNSFIPKLRRGFRP